MQLIAVGVKLQFENGCNVFTTSSLCDKTLLQNERKELQNTSI